MSTTRGSQAHTNPVEPQGTAEVPNGQAVRTNLILIFFALIVEKAKWQKEDAEKVIRWVDEVDDALAPKPDYTDDLLEADWYLEAHFYCKQNRSDEDQLEYQAWDDIRHGRTHFTHRYEGRGDDYRQMYFNARHRVEYFLKNWQRKLKSA